MNKKLLLSTVLSSALLASTAAEAAVREFTFDGNNQFTFEGNQYTGLVSLGTFLNTPGNINFDVDDVALSRATQRAFLDALKVNGSAERDGFSRILSTATGASLVEVQAEVNRALALISDLETNLGIDALDFFDFNDMFEDDLTELGEAGAYIEALGRTRAIEANVNTNFTNLETQLAASNQTIQTLVAEKNTLSAIANKTAEQNARLVELTKQILDSDEFNELRNSPQTQEVLKQNIELFRKALAANTNSTLSTKGRNDLKSFIENEVSKYLVLDPSNPAELPAVQQADNAAAEALVDTVLSNRTVLDSRIGDLGGISSGDMMETYGVWAKGTFSRATQKSHGKTQGYKLDSKGITIGVDTGDESLVGIAYSFFKNDVKNKTVSKNKEDITSHTISAYGKYTATPEVFISGQAQFGMAEIKKKRATGDAANNIATAKPKATILGAKAEIGYDYAAMEGVHLIPAVGVAYTDVKVKGYKESGNGLNREVGKINASRTSGIASLTAKYFADMGTMKLIPEVHANVDYAFNTKNGKTVVTLIEGLPAISTPSQKLEKGRYNVGTSVRAIQSDMFEFTAGYDFGFAKKFQSHTGTLKVRVNL